MLLFHHDPEHDDATLARLGREAAERWAELGGGEITMAREGQELGGRSKLAGRRGSGRSVTGSRTITGITRSGSGRW